MQFEARLTLDGLMTLLAGIIAFAAVIIQIRSSSKQLKKQLNAQRQSDLEEDERQKRAVAKAILYEIDDFARYHFADRPKFFEHEVPPHAKLPVMKVVNPKSLAVFKANAGRLGQLDDGAVKAIIDFYGAAETYQSLSRAYAEVSEIVHRGTYIILEREFALAILGELRELFPKLLQYIDLSCTELCKTTSVPRESLHIGQQTSRTGTDAQAYRY